MRHGERESSNQIFGSIYGSRDIARSLDTTFAKNHNFVDGYFENRIFAGHAVFAGNSQTLCTIVFNQKRWKFMARFLAKNPKKVLKNAHFSTLWMNQIFFRKSSHELPSFLIENDSAKCL